MSTTISPSSESSNSILRASGFLIFSLISRAIGLAPIVSLNPRSLNQSVTAGVHVNVTPRSLTIYFSSLRNLSVTLLMCPRSSLLNLTVASNRLRNSGLKKFLTALSCAVSCLPPLNPITFFSLSAAPKLLVRIITAFLALTALPSLLVTMPLSITCNITFKTSGCAFSTSSSRITEYGFQVVIHSWESFPTH